MFTATAVPVRPCGTASPAWLPRPAHRATPALDALERDEEAWTERSVTAIRAGEGLPGLVYGADSDGGGNSSGGGGGDNSGGGDQHHRILGFSVRNPEDLGLDRTVPPPPPLHVSEARIAAAEAVEAMGPPLDRSMSWEARLAERASRASSMPPPPPVMARGSASVATRSGGSSVGDAPAATPVGGSRRGRPGGRGTASSRRVVPARRTTTGVGRSSTGSAAADTSELTADSEVAVHQPRSSRARATAAASTIPASSRRAQWQRDPEMTAASAAARQSQRRPWQDDQDTTQEMEEDHPHDDMEHSSMYSDDI